MARQRQLRDVRCDAEAIAGRWRDHRAERQSRRHLERADFDALRDAGFLDLVVPLERGGLWEDSQRSLRTVCEIVRVLARGDSSVALVASMHPAVVGFWLCNDDPAQPQWEAQRQAVFGTALDGAQWGTITSEPGSGGDIARTRSVAEPDAGAPTSIPTSIPGGAYRISGDKHFGSGSGIVTYMVTSALPADGDGPAMFVLDVHDQPWERNEGMTLTAPWDGMGMAATQSHAMRLDGAAAVKFAWERPLPELAAGASAFISCLFTAVVLGVLDEAVGAARRQLSAKADALRPYEQVEWTQAEMDHWLAVQAYEGALRAAESLSPLDARHDALRGKQAVAGLAEQTMTRLTRVLGGGTFSRRSPFASWFEDVRALGFLRPPWGLSFDTLFASSLEPPA